MIQEESSSSSTVTSSSLSLHNFLHMSLAPGEPFPWQQQQREMKSEERGLCLIHLLLACTKHVASNSIDHANIGLEYISHLASPTGDTMQRIAAYFSEALADRMLKSWPGLHRALNSTKMVSSFAEEFLAQKHFFELCPFLKISYLVTNQAILEAMEGERMVHIIDLHASEPAQWINLLQAFKARQDGPPHLRITGIHEREEVLKQMAVQLVKEAERLDVPFQFNPVVVGSAGLERLDFESLRVKTGEALAISSVLQLHTLLSCPDDNKNVNGSAVVSSQNHHHHHNHHLRPGPVESNDNKDNVMKVIRALSPDSTTSSSMNNNNINSAQPQPRNSAASFLTSLHGLAPKIMVVTEQEANHNESSLVDRVMESLYFYAALFDCLESTHGHGRGSVERQKVEKMLFGEQIKNIVACDGAERRTRHEKLEKWIPRLNLAGFNRLPLSGQCQSLAGRFLQSSNGFNGYKIREEGACLFMCWQDSPLYSVSSWTSRRI